MLDILQSGKFEGVLQTRSNRYPFGWADAEFTVAGGSMRIFSRDGDSGDIPTATVIEMSIAGATNPWSHSSDAVAALTHGPGKRIIHGEGTLRNREGGTLSVHLTTEAGGLIEIRGLPTRLAALQAAIESQNAVGKASREAQNALATLSAAEASAYSLKSRRVRAGSREAYESRFDESRFETAAELFFALIEMDDLVGVRDVLDHGADAQMASASGVSVIQFAAQFGDSRIDHVKLLLQHGALAGTNAMERQEVVEISRRHAGVEAVTLLQYY